MNSDELNEQIYKLDNRVYEAWPESGKAVPYIGWYWREVNFDSDLYYFGVIPALHSDDGKPRVGFMQNNKWGYSYVRAEGDTWKRIRAGLEKAVTSMQAEDFMKVHEMIQNLIADRWYEYQACMDEDCECNKGSFSPKGIS